MFLETPIKGGSENVDDLFAFQFQLVRVIDVLVLTPRAIRIIFAAGRNALRRRGDDANDIGSGIAAFDFDKLNFNAFTAKDKRDAA